MTSAFSFFRIVACCRQASLPNKIVDDVDNLPVSSDMSIGILARQFGRIAESEHNFSNVNLQSARDRVIFLRKKMKEMEQRLMADSVVYRFRQQFPCRKFDILCKSDDPEQVFAPDKPSGLQPGNRKLLIRRVCKCESTSKLLMQVTLTADFTSLLYA